MNISYVIIGLLAGLFVGVFEGGFLLGMIGGGVIGAALGRLTVLEKRIRELEWRSGVADRAAATPLAEPAREEPLAETQAPPWETFGPQAEEAAAAAPEDIALQGLGVAAEPPDALEPLPPQEPARRPAPAFVGPSLAQRAIDKLTAWFTTGNVPVKIGVIVTFIGVSFLLKYAVDHELIVFPIEFRLLAVAAGGLALIVIGWRLREKTRTYALSLQGGGAGIMFLTIFAAFRIWDLLPALPAFVLLVAMALFTGMLAVLQNARSLAILGITGGFLAPVLASTGQGSHVVLFSYYLVLNAAILGIAWFRAWRGLNLLGFVFTFVIGGFWGYHNYLPELWASTQPFLVLYFLFYTAIAVLYALRQPPEKLGVVDGTLVFGTPVICSALQAALVQGTEYGLAISAAVVAVYYALLASWLYRNRDTYLRLLTESFIALAVAYATLAIPLALDARWTSAAWALEGAALVWVGTRQQRQLAKFAGVLLIIASGLAFLEHGWRAGQGLPVLNGNALGGILIALSALFASQRLQRPDHPDFEPARKLAAGVQFAWGVLWWLGTGLAEVFERVEWLHAGHVYLLFLAASFVTAARLGRAWQWPLLRRVSVLLLPGILFIAMDQGFTNEHLLREIGWLAWPLAWGVQVYLLRLMDEDQARPAGIWHVSSLLLLTGMLALEASWWIDQVASTAWAATAATAVLGTAALLVWQFRERPAWPVPVHAASYLGASLLLVTVQVLVLVLLAIDKPGNPDPLPYVPVLNPYDLAALFAAITALLSLRVLQYWRDARFELLGPYRLLLAAAFFVLTTAALVRGVHFYANVPWTGDALFGSVVVQTSLSIYWGLLGFAGMLLGARGTRRPLWMAGAGFMALVVLKLFLVDLGNTGTVERIISFIGIGALLLVVGYLAPVPPRFRAGSESKEEPS
jgi:uncharacterized membrane protein